MVKQSQTIEEEYKIKYDVESNSINLDTLLKSQIHFSVLLNEINKVLSPKNELNIKIRSFSDGSSIVDLVYQLLPATPLIMTPPSVQVIKNLFSFLNTYFNIKRFLNGEKADSIIQNSAGAMITKGDASLSVNNLTINNYIGNDVLDKLSRDVISTLENDGVINGLNIIQNNEPVISIPKSDFPILKARNKYFEDNIEVEIEDKYMPILKADFDTIKRGKWDFLYNGIRIHANIQNDGFYKQIDEGKRFGKGDCLNVTLKIIKEYDKQLNAFVNKQYERTKVIKMIPREEQEKLL